MKAMKPVIAVGNLVDLYGMESLVVTHHVRTIPYTVGDLIDLCGLESRAATPLVPTVVILTACRSTVPFSLPLKGLSLYLSSAFVSPFPGLLE